MLRDFAPMAVHGLTTGQPATTWKSATRKVFLCDCERIQELRGNSHGKP
jgi:hypothetical protein